MFPKPCDDEEEEEEEKDLCAHTHVGYIII